MNGTGQIQRLKKISTRDVRPKYRNFLRQRAMTITISNIMVLDLNKRYSIEI